MSDEMNMDDFLAQFEENAKSNKPKGVHNPNRIGRVSKNEKVVVEMLAEDLQEQFLFYQELADDMRRADEYRREEPNNVEALKEHDLCKTKYDIGRAKFWHNVTTRYSLWGKNVGIRDGFKVVIMPEDDLPRDMPEGLKKFIRKMKKDFNMDDFLDD